MNNTNQQNMITQGTSIDGNIKSQGDFRVEGNLKGDINNHWKNCCRKNRCN